MYHVLRKPGFSKIWLVCASLFHLKICIVAGLLILDLPCVLWPVHLICRVLACSILICRVCWPLPSRSAVCWPLFHLEICVMIKFFTLHAWKIESVTWWPKLSSSSEKFQN
ncbi:hypothetical protein AVEN_185254-1 [Araneus ventricosus]|uniref:Uncharacterized protein n=1 Tax=Araneus ventricosus TaxID=182803 RepID=A0A4Y2XD42_ARAVE|nr:hypothetical protein AVEN_185254-1 [Araneus ventricosus]